MSKERRSPDEIANELAQGSAFFRKPPSLQTDTQSPPPTATTPSPVATPKAEPVRPGRPVKRQMIRHPFELYMDQLERLRELAEEERRNGQVGSMSRMVREAIDRFLAERAE